MASPSIRLREYLASTSTIDCDTLNADVPHTLGPFQDCTSNQAILCAELARTEHHDLIKRCIEKAKSIKDDYPDVSQEELALDLCALSVQQLISVNITGYVHLQVNPFNSYNTDKIIANAKRIVSLATHLSPSSPLDPSRLCIKIPSTYEGLLACSHLEKTHNIRTLATTLFSLEQATLAAESNCTYIAPYILDLRCHIDPLYTCDPTHQFEVCRQAQLYYAHHGFATKVLAASLQTVDQLMRLAGTDHITVSQPLLQLLGEAEVDEHALQEIKSTSVFSNTADLPSELTKRWDHMTQESEFRIAFTRRDDGKAEGKQIQAINVFCDMQEALEKMIREFQ